MTCRNGVKTWLLNKVKAYAGDMPVREEQYFTFLDRLRVSGCEISQARQRLEQAFPHLKWCAIAHPVEKGCGKCVKASAVLVQEPTRRPLDSLGWRWYTVFVRVYPDDD